MTTANNPHSPANIVPADYEFAFPFCYSSVVDGWTVPAFNLDMVVELRKAGKMFSPKRTCHSCGARFIDGAVFQHIPTGQYIITGHICADKMELSYDISAMALVEGKRHEARKIIIEKALRRSELRTWVAQYMTPELHQAFRLDHHITRDIRMKLIQYRSVSQKQIDLVLRLQRQADERAQKAAATTFIPVPDTSDRLQIEGVILSAKAEEDFYSGSTSYKMLVQVGPDSGCYKLWGTIPSTILDQVGYTLANLRGLPISFAARVERSRKDEAFGFIKRPTKAKLLDPNVTCRSCKSKIALDDPELSFVWHPAAQQCDACHDAERTAKIEGSYENRTRDCQF